MRKLLFLTVILMAAASAFALPSYSGLRGLNRVVDARPSETGYLSLGLFLPWVFHLIREQLSSQLEQKQLQTQSTTVLVT